MRFHTVSLSTLGVSSFVDMCLPSTILTIFSQSHVHEVWYAYYGRCSECSGNADRSLADWEIWTAALVTSTSVRDLLISSVRKYAADGKSSQPLGDWYETTDGSVEGFRARPVVGGHLALVSLTVRVALCAIVLRVWCAACFAIGYGYLWRDDTRSEGDGHGRRVWQ